jgi:hypothetical protein
MFKFQQEMTKSYYEKILPANVHIFYEQGNMIDVKKHKSFGNFLFNEKHMVETLLSDIGNDINNDSILNESQKILYLAELQYIKAYTGYNDFNKMREIRFLNIRFVSSRIFLYNAPHNSGYPYNNYNNAGNLVDNF